MKIEIALKDYFMAYRANVTLIWNKNHAILNYALNVWKQLQQLPDRPLISHVISQVLTEEHDSIIIDLKPNKLRIEIPDEIYTLTQIKYAEYIHEY